MAIYQSNCRCITSAPDPQWSDPRYKKYTEEKALEVYHNDINLRQKEWALRLGKHQKTTGHRV